VGANIFGVVGLGFCPCAGQVAGGVLWSRRIGIEKGVEVVVSQDASIVGVREGGSGRRME